MKTPRVLVINPGSTSTKVAVYDGTVLVFSGTVRHDAEDLARFARIRDQLEFRTTAIQKQMAEHGVDLGSLAAVVGRGGLIKPVQGGVLVVNDAMIADLEAAVGGEHASNLGALMAARLARPIGIPAYVTDPVVVDELDDLARLSGLPEIERVSILHALNQKASARRAARELGRPYHEVDLVVAHMGGGITVGAHRHGRVVDVNNGLNGDGPFTPERSGGLPAGQLVRLCFSGRFSEVEILRKITGKGGLVAYLATSDARAVAKMIDGGDRWAERVYRAMAYQVAKEIGAMAAVLEGKVDGVVLTGGLAYDARFVEWIVRRVSFIGRVFVYAGENEMEALRDAGLRVLTGEEVAIVYQ